MSYWIDQPPSASNLRLFMSDGGWLAWDDQEEDGKTRRGASGQVEERLLSALNATNLMALLGSGASFAAKNADGKQALAWVIFGTMLGRRLGKMISTRL
ncbi:hypothetical protein ACFP8Z_03370 [Gemmobacter lanyuensis]|uniref:hypothetical protein n=1 Tax=Gemmobacter lanyuensis TaxID=1054497 RepID=UPI00361E4993